MAVDEIIYGVVKFAPKKHFRSKMIMGKRFAYPHHCLRPIVRKGKEGFQTILLTPRSWSPFFLGATPLTEFHFVDDYPS